MNILTLDVETTTFQKGNPFSKRNKLCYVGLKWLGQECTISNHINNQQQDVQSIQASINLASIVVGFNIKFDIHWLMNIGVTFDNVKQVWDCQIAEFLLESQQNPYNSLNDALEKYGLPRKLDVVKSNYWEKGIDTPEIPNEVITEYLAYDLEGTENVFIKQAEQFGIKL